ncbi:MAG: CHAT domain-containing protein [Pseudomonadota bacterium]
MQRQRYRFIAIAVTLLGVTAFSFSSAQQPLNGPIQRTLVDGEQHEYTLPRNGTLLVRVENSGRGTILSAVDDNGKARLRSANWRGIEGGYSMVLLPGEARTITIEPDTAIAPAGEYQIQISPLPRTSRTYRAERAMTLATDRHLSSYFGTADRRAEAVDFYQQAVTQFEAANEIARQADALYELGVVAAALGQNVEAIASLEQSANLFKSIDAVAGRAASQNQLGLIAWRQARYDDAIRLFDAALSLRQQQGSHYHQALLLNNKGLVYRDINDFSASIKALQTALRLNGITPDLLSSNLAPLIEDLPVPLTNIVTNLNNLGWVQDAAGDLNGARDTLERGLVLAESIQRPRPRTEIQINLARVYYGLGQLQRAYTHATDALDYFSNAGRNELWQANTLEVRASILEATGEWQQAHSDLVAALALRTLERHPAQRAHTLLRLGELSLATDQLSAITTFVDEVESIAARTDSATNILARSRALQGQVATKQGQFTLAQTLYLEAADLYQQSDSTVGLARVALWRSEAMTGEGDIAAAIALLRQARAIAETSTNTLLHMQATVRLSQALIDEGLQTESAALAREALLRSDTIRNNLKDPLLLRSFGSTQQQAYQILVEIAIAQDQHERAWMIANESRSRYLRDVVLSNRTASRNDVDELMTVESIQASLDDGETVAQFFIGTDAVHGWFITNQSMEFRQLLSRIELRQDVDRLNSAISQRRAPPADSVRRLSAALLPRNEFSSLLVLPAGAIYEVPFAHLSFGGEPIVANKDIRVLPLLTDVRTHSTIEPTELTVFADPVYRPADIKGNHTASLIASALAINEHRVIARGVTRTSLQKLGNLPGSLEEARAIQALSSDTQTHLYTGFDAARETVLQELPGDTGIVHFATHGIVDRHEPDDSGLVLSLFDETGAPLEALLSAQDISDLDIRSSLVVLSGCETGVGRVVVGEGVLSVSQAFLMAGAQRVLSSLWRIPDRATAVLMQEFYRQLIEQKQKPETALRLAQDTLRRSERWSDPYYWAGFQVFGR